MNILESAEELNEKGIVFTEKAIKEISVLTSAVSEILDLSLEAFVNNNLNAAAAIEPLEQVIDGLKKLLRNHHIVRLQQGECSIEAGFVWADLLTNLERTSDHCSNIAGCVVDITNSNMNLHESLREVRAGSLQYSENYESYVSKYSLAGI